MPVTVAVTDKAGNAATATLPYTITAPPVTDPANLPGYGLPVWREEFTGPLDPAKWNNRTDTQNNHLGKNEPGNLTIAAGVGTFACKRLATPYLTSTGVAKPYSTAYIDTNGKPGAVRYGRWAIRMRFGKAKGAWPAFWLRDAALLGELDIMEAVLDGKGGGVFALTVHESTNGDRAKRGYEWRPAGFDWAAFHEYAVEWDGTVMRWLVDNVEVTRVTVAQVPWLATAFGAAGMNIRLNYQAGGSMPNYFGLPMDGASVLPDGFDVDWVRVWRKP